MGGTPLVFRDSVGATGSVVRGFRPEDAPRWEAYVERSPEATFFHRIGWREILEDEFKHPTHYLIAELGAIVTGVLPLAEVRSRWFGHSLVSLPFGVYGGPAADDVETALALTDAAERLGRDLRVDHVELRNRSPLRTDWARSDLYVTFRKTLLPETEANLLAVPRKQRAMIRKGAKNGLTAQVDDDAQRFFALYADNMHRHGTPPFARSYFDRLLATFGDACEVQTVVDASGTAVSSVLSFYFRDEILPYYAGDTPDARDLAANDYKYWELMRRACERGIRVFDYGRSKRTTGSFSFKKNWGFEPVPLAYESRLVNATSLPQNNPLNPKYQAMIAIWRKLPRPLVNALGPHIVRGLG